MNRKQRSLIPHSALSVQSQKGAIPASVTNVRTTKDPEMVMFSVGHEHYRNDICMMKNMPASPLRKVLENYKRISLCTTPADFRRNLTGAKPINNSNAYTKYFANLEDDIELWEFDAGGFRTFFYIDNARKRAQIVAVDHHPENKKNVR